MEILSVYEITCIQSTTTDPTAKYGPTVPAQLPTQRSTLVVHTPQLDKAICSNYRVHNMSLKTDP